MSKPLSPVVQTLRELRARVRSGFVFRKLRGKDEPKGVEFSGGRRYRLLDDGSVRRVAPVRPWRGKSERRQVLKQRRADRALASAALKEAA